MQEIRRQQGVCLILLGPLSGLLHRDAAFDGVKLGLQRLCGFARYLVCQSRLCDLLATRDGVKQENPVLSMAAHEVLLGKQALGKAVAPCSAEAWHASPLL